jgi:hypothetical protein
MKVKTNELSGAQLDWAVAKAEGYPDEDISVDWNYSTDWAGWVALPEDAQFSEEEYQEGPTILIAAMRCYVASKLGEEVDMVNP